MISEHATCQARIEAHFEGRIVPDDERAMRLHLDGCAECRGRYARYWTFAEMDPQSLDPRERIGRGLGLVRPGASSRTLGAWLVAAATLGCLGLVMSRSWSPGEFVARGLSPVKAATVEVYHAQPLQAFSLAANAIQSSDELAFAYTNQAAYPFLVVCGVDEHGHVYWYHPAWTSADQDPDSVRIAESARIQELPEAISHALDGRELRVVAVFSRKPVRAREVERVLDANRASPSFHDALSEAFGDVVVVEKTFTVVP